MAGGRLGHGDADAIVTARITVVMGVSGCGKTTIGEALAAATGATFLDGDAFHTPNNIRKMSEGIPLTDEDRWPWLQDFARRMDRIDGAAVGSCSALKRIYRDLIRDTLDEPVRFVHLTGDPDLIMERMAVRTGHFMPTSLLESQLATLEVPGPDENAISVDIDATTDEIVAEIIRRTSP